MGVDCKPRFIIYAQTHLQHCVLQRCVLAPHVTQPQGRYSASKLAAGRALSPLHVNTNSYHVHRCGRPDHSLVPKPHPSRGGKGVWLHPA